MSIPSTLHKTPSGEFPLTTMSFLESSAPCTPAKFAAIRAGSSLLPAYFFVSSTEKLVTLARAMSFFTPSFSSPEISIVFNVLKDSSNPIFKINSFPELIITGTFLL